MSDRTRQRHEHTDRPVVGADLSFADRPGVPMEHAPQPLTPTAPDHFERMRPRRGLTHRKAIRQMTPVFGTAQPLHGLSGLLRRIAYSMHETRAKHWMTLLLADRVDLLEHRIARLVKLTAAATAATGAVVLTLRFFKS
ncbi:MAG TPA: hypothetical protein VFE90_00510 [Myxococcales bacterium]|jgi:hypothetical protein|nr:hypothetical protein [Myxococcales bacterium]